MCSRSTCSNVTPSGDSTASARIFPMGARSFGPRERITATKDEQNTVTHALNHAYRQSELIHRIEERDFYFSAGQLDEIQGALAQEAMVNDGILRGAHNREALAAGINAHALLQRLQCMGR